MKRADVIDNANIRPGDVIVGLASYGQATYEKEYNGGMGSNGLTSARHDVFAKYLAGKYPESYDHAVPEELVYSGRLSLTDAVEGSPVNAGKLVLSPTRTYAPVVKKLLDALRPQIHGMVHCSGGAQTKVLHFVLPYHQGTERNRLGRDVQGIQHGPSLRGISLARTRRRGHRHLEIVQHRRASHRTHRRKRP